MMIANCVNPIARSDCPGPINSLGPGAGAASPPETFEAIGGAIGYRITCHGSSPGLARTASGLTQRTLPHTATRTTLTASSLCSIFVPMSDTAARTDHELHLLESLIDCAKTISLALGEAAKVETDRARLLELVEAFQRGFFSVRMGIRLSLTLRAGPRPLRAALIAPEAETLETEKPERLEIERPETERAERPEREREREYEAVSLPTFLKTLGVVSADAARLDGLPAHVRAEALPTLERLLAQADAQAPPVPAKRPQPAKSAPTTGVDLLLRPPKAAPRSRWLGSTATVLPKPFPLAGPFRARPPPR